MLFFRNATADDAPLYFRWANDSAVRLNAINSKPILWEEHNNWFAKAIKDECKMMIVCCNEVEAVGQIRIEVSDEKKEGLIDYSVDEKYRGQGFGTEIIKKGYQLFAALYKNYALTGLVKVKNFPSVSAFKKSGFIISEELNIQDEKYVKFIKE